MQSVLSALVEAPNQAASGVDCQVGVYEAVDPVTGRTSLLPVACATLPTTPSTSELYVRISRNDAWFRRFVMGRTPSRRPFQGTTFLKTLTKLAWHPPVIGQEKLGQLDLDDSGGEEEEVEVPKAASKSSKTGDVVRVFVDMLPVLWYLVDREQDARVERVCVQVWLRQGQLYVLDDRTQLDSIKAHLLQEARPRVHEAANIVKRGSSKGVWWVKTTRKERGYWMVRSKSVKTRKFRLDPKVFIFCRIHDRHSSFCFNAG
jgi:hypothetical protein